MSSIQLNTYQNLRLEPHIGMISAIIFAGLTGLGALLVIPLPFTPIPITGQTFVVLLSGFILGKKYGPISQLIYLVIGFLGVPWFAGGTSGIDILLGTSGGYLVGFVIASFIIGYFTDIDAIFRKPTSLILFASIGTIVIYIFGVSGLILATSLDLWNALLLGFFPFIPGDFLKLVLVIFTSYILLPRGESKSDDGFSKGKRYQLISFSVLISIMTVITFVVYLLTAGDHPPVNLVAFSLLSLFIVLPNIFVVSRSISILD